MPTSKNFDDITFGPPIFIECLKYAMHCSRCCWYSTEQNRDKK